MTCVIETRDVLYMHGICYTGMGYVKQTWSMLYRPGIHAWCMLGMGHMQACDMLYSPMMLYRSVIYYTGQGYVIQA